MDKAPFIQNRPSTNPFATRYVRPGAIAFRFAEGESARRLVARLQANGWRGQIVGAHGTGKSTLLASLRPALEAAGRSVVSFSLHDGQRRLPANPRLLRSLREQDMLVIDGYEQLGAMARFSLRLICRKSRCGLLVTAHADVGLPALYATQVDLSTAQSIAADLLSGAESTISQADVEQALTQHSGNLREALFYLYDLYELRRSS
ncbi:MAG TPA: hypothetical protein VHC19_24990 [Pirellulales bacterium]|nr:hypothetical protein [Pirellulales bacterium]